MWNYGELFNLKAEQEARKLKAHKAKCQSSYAKARKKRK